MISSALPSRLKAIEAATKAQGFTMPSDRETGSLLRMMCASKPSGRFLEIGTGTGLSACWMLDGMDSESHLDSVDNDPVVVDLAREHLTDERISFHVGDGLDFIRSLPAASYDLIFADAMPGKYDGFEATMQLLRGGGVCVLDDMLPQDNWPENHQSRVDGLTAYILRSPDLSSVFLEWSTGIIICAKVPNKAVNRTP